ncbi:SDR family NAD(P)-dependent oxidoreductase [Acrocarpospora catenulata]|uniref:SDR family NAD(P)-dependent oxidoreductase n=1 Tax=Acrocarpospora catenulata TaxID=2836182 RepID=UPI001BD9A331|nr:SDR family oxidoreductase [Acrocarpospora catenulata]
MDLELAGRRALITGASAGIGRATARLLAAEGAQLVLVARRLDALETLAAELEASGPGGTDLEAGGRPRPLCLAADLTDPDAPARLREQVTDRLGGLDILINNAGRAEPAGVTLDEALWRSQFELNFHAKRRLAEEFLPLLAAGGQGRVINLVGILEPFGVSAAQAAVAACVLWAKGLARVVADRQVTVNCVAPGRIDSEQIRAHFPTREAQQEFARGLIPAGRFGTAEEAAALIVFLASGPARYITGDTFTVDGGMHRSI